MTKKNKQIIIVVAILAVVFVACLSTYNSLVSKDEACMKQWSKVESQYQRRLDLIPNLISVVKGYAKHEEGTLLKVIEARNNASQVKVDPSKMTQEQLDQFQQSQAELTSALRSINVVVERYPDLKANQNFLELQSQLEGTENRIAVERQRYSDVVNEYNTSIRRFPKNIIASCFGFDKRLTSKHNKGLKMLPRWSSNH